MHTSYPTQGEEFQTMSSLLSDPNYCLSFIDLKLHLVVYRRRETFPLIYRYQASSISFEDVLAFAGGFSTQAGAPKDSAVRLVENILHYYSASCQSFYRYNITSDSWEDLKQKLEVGRAYATAIPVPDDLAGCSRAAETADDEEKMEDAFDEYLRSA